MQPLSESFDSVGFHFRQIQRIGRVAVYKRTRIGGKSVDYETIRVQTRQPFTIKGVSYPEAEVYPPSESWGTHGFTNATLEAALSRAARLARKAPMVASHSV